MTKSSINCPYCNNEIIFEYSKVKTTKEKKKSEPILIKAKTMNDYASVMKVKKMDDLVITSLSYFYYTIQRMQLLDW